MKICLFNKLEHTVGHFMQNLTQNIIHNSNFSSYFISLTWKYMQVL